MELPPPAPDGVIYLTTTQAAKLAGVACCTITSWRHKGYLKPLEGSPPRKPMYSFKAVCEAEFQAWQNAIRTSGNDKRVHRRRIQPGEAD